MRDQDTDTKARSWADERSQPPGTADEAAVRDCPGQGLLFCPRCGVPVPACEVCPRCSARICPACGEA